MHACIHCCVLAFFYVFFGSYSTDLWSHSHALYFCLLLLLLAVHSDWNELIEHIEWAIANTEHKPYSEIRGTKHCVSAYVCSIWFYFPFLFFGTVHIELWYSADRSKESCVSVSERGKYSNQVCIVIKISWCLYLQFNEHV